MNSENRPISYFDLKGLFLLNDDVTAGRKWNLKPEVTFLHNVASGINGKMDRAFWQISQKARFIAPTAKQLLILVNNNSTQFSTLRRHPPCRARASASDLYGHLRPPQTLHNSPCIVHSEIPLRRRSHSIMSSCFSFHV